MIFQKDEIQSRRGCHVQTKYMWAYNPEFAVDGHRDDVRNGSMDDAPR